MSSEQRDEVVDRLVRNIHNSVTAKIHNDVGGAAALIDENARILDKLPMEERSAIEKTALARLQLSNRLMDALLEASARRKLVSAADGVAGAMWTLCPKRLDSEGWHAADPEDMKAIDAFWNFIARHGLAPLLNEMRDRHFKAHHDRLGSVPGEKLDELLDEIGAERDARLRAGLHPEDWEWIADRLANEGVQWGDVDLPVRQKDVAKVLDRSESWRRVRKLRQKTSGVTPRPRKKR
jgi:hypothetical protein